jgi:hypothetical protein
MPKNAATRFIQHKTPQPIILGDETTLLPNRLAGRWRNPADNHIANFTFGVATDNINDA